MTAWASPGKAFETQPVSDKFSSEAGFCIFCPDNRTLPLLYYNHKLIIGCEDILAEAMQETLYHTHKLKRAGAVLFFMAVLVTVVLHFIYLSIFCVCSAVLAQLIRLTVIHIYKFRRSDAHD